jgi:hypothetical protein
LKVAELREFPPESSTFQWLWKVAEDMLSALASEPKSRAAAKTEKAGIWRNAFKRILFKKAPENSNAMIRGNDCKKRA